MKVEVRYFASLADAVGQAHETVELGDGETVEGLWAALVARHPELGRVKFRPLVACDMDYADWDRALDGVREVAFLPPVSGG
jgi:molybdopterin synthase sulfur carrier subunit